MIVKFNIMTVIGSVFTKTISMLSCLCERTKRPPGSRNVTRCHPVVKKLLSSNLIGRNAVDLFNNIPGKIVKSGYSAGFGDTVTIEVVEDYRHLNRLSWEWETVEKGTRIMCIYPAGVAVL